MYYPTEEIFRVENVCITLKFLKSFLIFIRILDIISGLVKDIVRRLYFSKQHFLNLHTSQNAGLLSLRLLLGNK